MIFNATNVKPARGPSLHTSTGRYIMINSKGAELLGLNGHTKISFKIEDGEFLIYHDEMEGILPDKKNQGYRINSKKLVNFLKEETKQNLPTFEIIKIQKDTFEMKLKSKTE